METSSLSQNEVSPEPRGVRALYVGDESRNSNIASALSEHARRSDSILGLYVTLFLSEMSTRSQKGGASTRELELLSRLGIK